MGKKRGNLRVRKGNALFGPMLRADLAKLVESGRLAPTDQVSADDGPWQPVGTYLQRTADEAAQEQPAEEPSSAWKAATPAVSRQPPGEQPTLRVLKENRVFPPMTRKQVADLRTAGRLTGDELICALHGPWMRVSDFFAPPAAPAPASAFKPHGVQGQGTGIQGQGRAAGDEAPVEAEIVEEDVAWASEVVEDELDVIEEDDLDVIEEDQVPVAETAYPATSLVQPARKLSDNWYVKVRGIHSAPLQKHHIKMLLAAREIDADAPTCHVSWRSEAWLPLGQVPELADLAKRP